MNLVTDQVYDQESTASVERKYGSCTNYTYVSADTPPAEEETTIEQLTELWTLVKSGAPPYVDLAVWVVTQISLAKEIAPHWLQLTTGGTLRPPPTYGMREQCYKCLNTGLIMLKAVSIAKI